MPDRTLTTPNLLIAMAATRLALKSRLSPQQSPGGPRPQCDDNIDRLIQPLPSKKSVSGSLWQPCRALPRQASFVDTAYLGSRTPAHVFVTVLPSDRRAHQPCRALRRHRRCLPVGREAAGPGADYGLSSDECRRVKAMVGTRAARYAFICREAWTCCELRYVCCTDLLRLLNKALR